MTSFRGQWVEGQRGKASQRSDMNAPNGSSNLVSDDTIVLTAETVKRSKVKVTRSTCVCLSVLNYAFKNHKNVPITCSPCSLLRDVNLTKKKCFAEVLALQLHGESKTKTQYCCP